MFIFIHGEVILVTLLTTWESKCCLDQEHRKKNLINFFFVWVIQTSSFCNCSNKFGFLHLVNTTIGVFALLRDAEHFLRELTSKFTTSYYFSMILLSWSRIRAAVTVWHNMAVEQVAWARGLVTWGKRNFMCLLLQLLSVKGINFDTRSGLVLWLQMRSLAVVLIYDGEKYEKLKKRVGYHKVKEDRQYKYNVILRRVRINMFAVEKQWVLHILSVCSLS